MERCTALFAVADIAFSAELSRFSRLTLYTDAFTWTGGLLGLGIVEHSEQRKVDGQPIDSHGSIHDRATMRAHSRRIKNLDHTICTQRMSAWCNERSIGTVGCGTERLEADEACFRHGSSKRSHQSVSKTITDKVRTF